MMFSPLCPFMFNLGIMYDALTELSDLCSGCQLPSNLFLMLSIAVSASECERAFSCMNHVLTVKRNSSELAVSTLSNLVEMQWTIRAVQSQKLCKFMTGNGVEICR